MQSKLPRGLAVDDDVDLLRVVAHALELAGLEVAMATSAGAALRWIDREGLPHLGLFDVNMPEKTGIELCREIHRFADLPVIFLTVIDDEDTLVSTIEELAEDYLTKPFRPRELVARVRTVLRRFGDSSRGGGTVVRVDDHLSFRLHQQMAIVEGREIALTPTEAKLLHILLRSAPRIVSNEHLLGRVWPGQEVFEDTLRVHVHRLRQKIEVDASRPRHVVTHRGVGYAFGAVAE